jgi:hypothetical protein
MNCGRKFRHAIADALFHWNARGCGDPAFGWSAIIAREQSLDQCSGSIADE